MFKCSSSENVEASDALVNASFAWLTGTHVCCISNQKDCHLSDLVCSMKQDLSILLVKVNEDSETKTAKCGLVVLINE